jgi:penicillin-binding protein 2
MSEKLNARRRYVIITIFIIVAVIFLVKLFLLQVLDHDYKLFAKNNVLRYITRYPARGLIYDRNGELLVYNEAAYDLLVIPRQVKEVDTAEFCRLLNISAEDFRERFDRALKYSAYKPSIFLEQISREEYGYFEEKLFKYPGFYIEARTLRKYPIPIAAHILGYVGEVNQRELDKDHYYTQGDYIGKSGIERSYENLLRGEKGVEVVMVDVFNREKGSYQGGKYDTLAYKGNDLFLTINAGLQQFGEELMQNKKGSIVAIEPSSGEVLAFVSSPAYDPNLLIGRVRTKNFNRLSKDTLEPLFIRPTQAQYPPGSTFKLLNALIALQEGVITPGTEFDCDGPVSKPIVCSHFHINPANLIEAIEESCNPYFWNTYRSLIEQPEFKTIQEGYNNWRNYLLTFNLGQSFDSDLPVQRKGNLPEDSYFNRYYGEKGWRAITIRSLSIGQGEIELTPLQLANVAATIGNRGYFYTPHLVKSVDSLNYPYKKFKKKNVTSIDSAYYEPVIEGMQRVFGGEHGTARWYKIKNIEMCGKTGTAENPHGDDHSIFIAFAPADNPGIAIAVVVETCGFGSTWAAPIASLMMEKYLYGEAEDSWYKAKMLNANLLDGSEE